METESLKNFEEESNNVGLDTGLVAVTGLNTGGEGAEVGVNERLGKVGSQGGADRRLVGANDMVGEEDDGMV